MAVQLSSSECRSDGVFLAQYYLGRSVRNQTAGDMTTFDLGGILYVYIFWCVSDKCEV